MNRTRVATALVTLLLLAVACATTGGMRAEPIDRGVARTFTGDYPTVLRAVRNAVTNAGLAVDTFEEPNDSTAVIVAKKGSSAWSWGELVRVVVEKTSPTDVTVRVLSKRKLATNVTAKSDYTDTIFSNVELALR